MKTLREMEEEVRGIRNHCSSEERNVELRYSCYLRKGQLGRLKQDHEELGRLASTWAIELRFATLDQVNAAQAAGRQLALCN
ncbi:MAG TPA: hypothetical protein VGS20_10855 [Candidatus Acidoferrales bacterium]|nr:hypothetical protein [Candidatus Acidoferrales bacterium]